MTKSPKHSHIADPIDPRGAGIYTPALPALLCILIMICSFALAYLANEDIWWYLSSGAAVIDQGGLPDHDMFLYPLGDEAAWISHSWLWTVILAALNQTVGLSSVVVFGAILVGVLITLVFTSAKLDRYGLINTLAVAMIIVAGPRRLMLRAELATWLLLVVLVRLFERGGAFTWRSGILLAVLQWLWCNLHGSWPLGILVVIAYSMDSWWARRQSRHNTEKTGKGPPLWLGPALILTCQLTPHMSLFGVLDDFMTAVGYIFGGGGGLSGISEWRSTFSGTWPRYEWAFIGLVVLGAASFFVSQAPRKLARALIFVVMAVLAIAAVRFVVGFGVVTTVVLMLNIRRLDPRLVNAYRNAHFSVPRISHILAIIFVCFFMLIATAGLWTTRDDFEAGQSTDHFFTIDPMWMCSGAVDYVIENKLPGPIFNDIAIGGYLTYQLYPDHRAFIDSRVLDYSFQQDEYSPAIASPQNWYALENRFSFKTAILGHYGAIPILPLVGTLTNDPRWELVYIDPQASVFVRREETPASPRFNFSGEGTREDGVPFVTPRRFSLSQTAQSLGRFMRHIMMESSVSELLSNYLLLLGALNQSQAVDDLATRALQTRRDDAGILRIRGLSRVRSGRSKDGIEDLRQSIASEPEDVRGYLSLALALHSLGQRRSALDVVAVAERLEPNNPQVRALRQQISSGR